MKRFLSLWYALLVYASVSAQEITALKDVRPIAGKHFQVSYDAAGGPLATAERVAGIAVFYAGVHKAQTLAFQMKKQKARWEGAIRVPDSTLLVYLVFTDEQQKVMDNRDGKGYLLPAYSKGRPVRYAYATMALLTDGGPPDPYGLKKNQDRALQFMKQEMYFHPESEAPLRQRFYNMLANSPERDDKADLVKRLTALQSDKESDLMMAQLYLSFLGTKQQADSLDKLLKTRFPDGEYVKQKKSRKQQPGEDHKPVEKKAVDTLQLITELKKNMLKEPVAEIMLKDMNGEPVVLGGAGMKGKVMVIDFWATWCGPCVRSFPAMQKVMDKYKDNPNVKFFYICTMEEGDALKTVKDYLSKNPLPFTILMDEKTSDMNLYKAFTHYKGGRGIPYKLVIDGAGNVRFRTLGFSGDEGLLEAELSAMINLSL